MGFIGKDIYKSINRIVVITRITLIRSRHPQNEEMCILLPQLT